MASRIRYGYRRLHVLLRREGWRVNAKRIWRLYAEEGLSIRAKQPRRRRAWRHWIGRPATGAPKDVWAMDFMWDGRFDGRLRAECLNASWFLPLAGARDQIEEWRRHYNEEDPILPSGS